MMHIEESTTILPIARDDLDYSAAGYGKNH